MISIERLLTIKPEVSKLFVFLRQENELITSKFVEHDILNFVNQQIQENDKDFLLSIILVILHLWHLSKRMMMFLCRLRHLENLVLKF